MGTGTLSGERCYKTGSHVLLQKIFAGDYGARSLYCPLGEDFTRSPPVIRPVSLNFSNISQTSDSSFFTGPADEIGGRGKGAYHATN